MSAQKVPKTFEQYLRDNFLNGTMDYAARAMVAGDQNGPVIFYVFPPDVSPDEEAGHAVGFIVSGDTLTPQEE